MPNPFAALGAGGSDDEDGTTPVVAKTTAAPKQSNKKVSRSDKPSAPAAKEDYRGGQSNGAFESGDTRRQNHRGGRGGRGGGGRGDRRDYKRSQGKAGNKPDEKRDGHGTGNWGSKNDDIADVMQGVADASIDAKSPEPEEPEPEPEEETLSLEEYLAQQKGKSSKVGSLKIREAGDGDSGVKKGEAVVKKVEEGPYGGSKYGNRNNKLRDERKGRAANAERLLVDIKYAPSEQVDRGDAPRGGRGRGEGRGSGRGRGEGRGRGRGRGRGEGRGRGRDNRGRGGRGGGRGGSAPFNADDFPSL